MKQKVLLTVVGVAILVFGGTWLYAAPTIGAVSVTPTVISVNTPTTVTVTAVITDPLLLPQSVNVIELYNGSSTVLGVLHDDGLNGDAVAGDHIFTALVRLDENYPNPVTLQVSAAFSGLLRRVTSAPVPVTVQGVVLSTVVATTPYVVQGTVASLNSYYSGIDIFTDIQLTVTATIKGPSLPSSILVSTLGGVVGSDSQQPTGSPGFTTGQQVVLFLGGPGSDGKYFLSYGVLGVFRIESNNGQMIAVVDPGYSFMEMAEPLDSSYATILSQSSQLSLSLASLIATISGP